MKHLAQITALLLLALCAPALAESPEPCLKTHIFTYPTKTHGSITEEDIKLTLKLEIVATPAEREHGLMNRTSMGACDGMAFWFPNEAGRIGQPKFKSQKFWMKNTYLPLDIIFVSESGRIIYIGAGEPLSLKQIGTDVPVASVIEIEGGRAEKEGIRVGDYVHYEVATQTWQLAR